MNRMQRNRLLLIASEMRAMASEVEAMVAGREEPKRCSNCKKAGHNIKRCPEFKHGDAPWGRATAN